MLGVYIVTVSDSCARGESRDRSGEALREAVEKRGWRVRGGEVLPDERERIAERLGALADGGGIELVVTTGGTGIAARDVTPEAARMVAEREIPGFGEAMRAEGRKKTARAALSRSLAVTRGRTLIVCLPGSPKGAVESLEAVAELIPHACRLLAGETEHGPREPMSAKLES